MKAIPVSAYADYSYCPRSLYLSLNLRLPRDMSLERTKEVLGGALRKEFNMRQVRLLERLSDPDGLEYALLAELETVIEEVPKKSTDLSAVGPEILQKCAFDLRPVLLEETEIIRERLAYMIDSVGLEGVLKRIRPWRTDYSVKSESLGLSGRIDKVMKEGKIFYPTDIKTREYRGGAWEEDRVQICAYSLLLEEDVETKVPYGFLEYVRKQERVPVMNTPKLKETVLELRDEIREILSGDVPDVCSHGSGKKCEACCFAGRCFDI